MADETVRETTTVERAKSDGNQIPSGFLDKMLGQMHPFAASMIGSFLGFAVAFILVLKLGGMDVPFSRILNAYASGIEAQMTKVVDTASEMTKKINDANATLTTMSENLNTVNVSLADVVSRVEIVERQIPGLTNRVAALENQVQELAEAGAGVPALSSKVDALSANLESIKLWACEHEKRVTTAKSFGPTSACDPLRTPRMQ